VTKVHAEAKRYAAEGSTVVLVGHAGHEEVEGTMGEAPEAIVLVETVADAESLEVEDSRRIAYVTQTTLSMTRRARSSPSCTAVFRAYAARRRKTSATRRRTASGRSRNCWSMCNCS
jgi:4-hydroxy-3-methylbut-2-en-1-yl diphosphate reductase